VMDVFLTQPVERQRVIYEEAARRLGLSAGSVEKDLWVCWTLRALFRLPSSGPHLTLKGGTSLSKGWKLIDRFSEDIDIVINREFLGFGGADAPEDAPSNKQRGKRLDALMLAAQSHIRNVLGPALEEEVRHLLRSTARWTLEPDADDPGAQTLLFHYPPAMGTAAYVRPVVKIELGARSDTEPSATPEIVPYLAEVFPDEVRDGRFTVHAVAPERTFWEKVTILHAWYHAPAEKVLRDRQSRHYYDVSRMYEHGIGRKAMKDTSLLIAVAKHKEVFFPAAWANYREAKPGTIRIVPPDSRMGELRRDYQSMQEMIFGLVPSFEHIVTVLGEVESSINTGR